MKVSTNALVALLATTTIVHAQEDDRGCVESSSLEPGQDLFYHKVRPQYSQKWDVEYFETYKIVTNKQFDLTYLLYQCGTEVPAEQQDGRHAAILEIPLSDVAITVTPFISYMEQLGLRDEISTFLSDATYVSSPCFAEAIATGEITSLNRGDEETAPSLQGLTVPNESNLVTFISGYEQSYESARPPFANTVIAVSEDEEETNSAIFEWVKFFSVFFNKEEVANKVFGTAESRYQCVAQNAGQLRADGGEKPKLLWGKMRLVQSFWFLGGLG